MRRTPELLAPAGSLDMLKTALAYGATAVYAGQPRYSLRVRNNDFGDLAVLDAGVQHCHQRGAAFYLVSNIYPHEAKLKTYLADMAPVIALKPDALIMSDPGLIGMVREHWPDQAIHLSVQANTLNSAAIRFWKSVGISRVILSRELSLEQIAEIREACPDTELEVFIHGALCIAYSGRCLISGYLNHRDPNQGTCTNACRWEYKAEPARTDAAGDIWLVEEQGRRQGEFMPLEEDEHGTYLFNSRDLRAIEHIQRLVEIGIDSFKIEGRTKSSYYVARSVLAYRQAIDDAVSGRGFDPTLLGQLEGLANRGYTGGFFERHTPADTQNYLSGHSESGRSQYAAEVLRFDAARGWVEVLSRNQFSVGDVLEVVQPAGIRQMPLTAIYNAEGQPINRIPGCDHRAWLPLPADTVGAYLARMF